MLRFPPHRLVALCALVLKLKEDDLTGEFEAAAPGGVVDESAVFEDDIAVDQSGDDAGGEGVSG